MGSLEDDFTSPDPEKMVKICKSGPLGFAFLVNPINPLYQIDQQVVVHSNVSDQTGIILERGRSFFGNVYKIRFPDGTEDDTLEHNVSSA